MMNRLAAANPDRNGGGGEAREKEPASQKSSHLRLWYPWNLPDPMGRALISEVHVPPTHIHERAHFQE